ncbi:hypothetical protein SDC9_194254 [bioreactor metagenome]|uniref:Uncharacterized protein n=1 Tax=bioreactor metagenome TaxID=1076179 RepID=A0A645I5Y0_9ZZZZ
MKPHSAMGLSAAVLDLKVKERPIASVPVAMNCTVAVVLVLSVIVPPLSDRVPAATLVYGTAAPPFMDMRQSISRPSISVPLTPTAIASVL